MKVVGSAFRVEGSEPDRDRLIPVRVPAANDRPRVRHRVSGVEPLILNAELYKGVELSV